MDWKFLLRYWAGKLLIKLGKIKQEAYSEAIINQLIAEQMPQKFAIDFPASKGELVIMEIEIAMPTNQPKIETELLCSFTIDASNQRLYQAHILLTGSVFPYFCKDSRSVKFKDPRVDKVQLINDDYSFIGSAVGLADRLTPFPFKGLVSNTFTAAMTVMSTFSPQEITSYFAMFSKGNKQRILDYHRPKIEQTIIDEVAKGDLDIVMNQDVVDERLFAEYGREVIVEDRQLLFKF